MGSSLPPLSLCGARIQRDASWVLPQTSLLLPLLSISGLLQGRARPNWGRDGSGSFALPMAMRSPLPRCAHTHTGTGALPSLLPPGDVTQLSTGGLIPFLTF